MRTGSPGPGISSGSRTERSSGWPRGWGPGGATRRMDRGLEAGVVWPRLVMANVLEQLDAMLAEGVEGSSFYRPVANFPAEVPAADQTRLKAAYARSIATHIPPPLT